MRRAPSGGVVRVEFLTGASACEATPCLSLEFGWIDAGELFMITSIAVCHTRERQRAAWHFAGFGLIDIAAILLLLPLPLTSASPTIRCGRPLLGTCHVGGGGRITYVVSEPVACNTHTRTALALPNSIDSSHRQTGRPCGLPPGRRGLGRIWSRCSGPWAGTVTDEAEVSSVDRSGFVMCRGGRGHAGRQGRRGPSGRRGKKSHK